MSCSRSTNMHKDITQKLFALAQGAKSIVVTTHINSDGDGMVASLALQMLLKMNGLASTLVTDGEDISRYGFLMRDQVVEPFHDQMRCDLCIVLDCNSFDRIGNRRLLVDTAKNVVVLDHHVVEHNPIPATLSLIDHAYGSVGILLWHCLKSAISKLDASSRKYIADCVYVTILNDSNNFSNANTNHAMFATAAELAREGILPHLLHMAYLQNHSAKEMLYVGKSLANIRLLADDSFLFLHSDYALAQELEINPSDYMSVTRWVQGVSGLKAIAYFREDHPGDWKISLRSLELNVQEIAARYGGGGHRKASGLSLKGSLQEVQQIILSALQTAHPIS